MLIAFLISMLIHTLIGGPEEIFMVPKLEKEIKSHVVDDERKNEILQIIKEAKKEIKQFRKFRKSKLKEIKKIGAKKEVSSDEMLEVFEIYNNTRLSLQSDLIEKRLILQQLFSDEEWELIIENAVFPSDKDRKKADKQEDKIEKKIEEFIADIKATIESNIEDESKRSNVLNSLDNYSTTLITFIEEGQQMNYKDNNIARSKNANKNELDQFYQNQNKLRYKGAKEYMKLRTTVIRNTNEKEWKAIIKDLNKFING